MGRKWMIAGGLWVQALGIALVALSAGLAGFAAGAVLLGLGTAMVYPTLLAAIGDVAHPSWRASAVGVYRLWRDLERSRATKSSSRLRIAKPACRSSPSASSGARRWSLLARPWARGVAFPQPQSLDDVRHPLPALPLAVVEPQPEKSARVRVVADPVESRRGSRSSAPTAKRSSSWESVQSLGGVESEIVMLSDHDVKTCRGCKACGDRGEEVGSR